MANGKPTIDALPDEVLVMVMSSLCTEDLIRCSMVCHRWQRLATEKTLWRRATINDYTVIPLRSLAKLVQRGIHRFDLSGVIVSDPDLWSRIFTPPTYTSPITFLDLTQVGISEEALQCLLKPMNQLQELRLGCCTCRLNRNCCAAIAKNKQLRTLDLSECRPIDTGGLKTILKNCQRLGDLDLSETNLNRFNLDVISKKLPASLLRLNLRNCGLLFSDAHLTKIVKLCPNLTHLDISANRFLSHTALEATAALRNLEELKNDQVALDSDDDWHVEDIFDSDASVSVDMSDFSHDSSDSSDVGLDLLLNDFPSSDSDSSFVHSDHESSDDLDGDVLQSDDDFSESSDDDD